MGDKNGLELSVPQIAGSALAAATAAVAASFLGVTGTVIGAALASAGTTVGNAVYTHYIHRTRDRIKEAHGLITGEVEAAGERERREVTARPGEEGLATAVHATVRDHGPADLPHGDATTPLSPAQVPPLRREGRRGPLWVTLIVAAAATFALSMGGILAFELVSGKPLTATVQGRDGSGTSLGGTVSERRDPAPAPSTSPEAGTGRATEPSAKATPAETGDESAGPAQPSADPSSPAPENRTGAPENGTGVEPSADSGVGRQDGRAGTGQPSTTSR
ncbi:hypothetical protein DQ384_14915 [Sphaerisporangium album]|uniref:Uncharacterized protein n=1 Tax=Sphaerisporangium album TaxID=509200 RepID=A0A367FJL6_9ACTN|nr:hypothetical protein [Sphaerisporangium album]RCG30588.1 hypothetical protein DQ384_14915 [Sphaerisporangium album]